MPWDVKSSFKPGLQISLESNQTVMSLLKKMFSRFNSENTSFWIEPGGRKCILFWHKIGEICCQLVPSGNRNSTYFLGSFFLQPLISSNYVLVRTLCPSKRLMEYKKVIEIHMVFSFFELHTVESKLFVVLHCVSSQDASILFCYGCQDFSA
jgi:hypothetical protein